MSQLLDFTPSPDKIRNAVQGMTVAAPQAEPGLFGKAWNSLKAVAEGVTRIPGGVADTLSDVAGGGDIDVTDEAALQALEERRTDQQAYLQRYEGQAFSGVAGAMESMPYSLATMGGSILGGVLAGPAGGMGAAGAVAARGTRTQFMQDMLDAAKQALGRMPTEDEWAAISRAYADDADAYALWEAVPEALTNSLFLKILGPVGKEAFASLGIKSALGRGAAELAATQLEEQTGETVTQWGQGGIETRAGLRAQAPTLGEAFGEQAPTTFWQTLLMHGGGKTARWGFDKLTGISGTRPDGKAGAAAGLRSLVEGRSEVDAMKPKAPGTDLVPVGQPYTVYDAEIVPPPADFMVTPGGRVAGRYAARPPQGAPIMADAGQAFLPEGARPLPETPAALPVGTGAIPAGSVATGRGIIATPTEYIGGPVAPPFTERPALPAQTGQAAAGRWPGGLSQLAYGPAGGGMARAPEAAIPILLSANPAPAPRTAPPVDAAPFTPNRADGEDKQNTASGSFAEMIPSGNDTEENQGARHDAAGQGRFAGIDGTIGHDAIPARGNEGRAAGVVPEGLGRPGGSPSGAPGNSASLRREGNVGEVRKDPEGRGGQAKSGTGRRGTSIKIPSRNDEPATYELVEADEVRASHLPEFSFQKNPWYELENERRYHDEPASRRKVLEHAARLDPDFVLKDSVDANNGAPVVDRNGNVLGGNGRAMSIRQAYHTGGERAEAYRAALRDRAGELGLEPADVDAMQRPMLVRRLDKAHSHAERQALVTAMNDTFTDSKSARASGKTRGDRLSGRGLGMLAEGLKEAETLRQYFDEPESVAVVEQFIRDGVIQATERNAYVGADGLLNPDGKRVVEEALRGRIARNYDALAKLPADLVGKLDAAIPHILVAEGVGAPWNITEHVRDAVDLLAAFKSSGEKDPNIWLHQLDMLTGKTPMEGAGPQAIAVFRNALREKKSGFVGMFAAYAAQAGISPEAGGMPGLGRSQAEAFAGTLGGGLEAKKAGNNASSASETPEKNADRKDYGTPDAPDTVALSRHFAAVLLQGAKYDSIVQARREAGELLGGLVRPATETAKKVDEAIELGVTMAARRMVGDMRAHKESDQAIFRALVDLYQRQPTLGVRTSTSIAQQAYSTPAPIAFLASRLAGITPARSVYEPTAGNGMLLLEASPDRAVVNELNPERAARLRSQGFEVTERDAADYAPSAKVDVVIANPPFGRTRGGDNRAREFTLGSFVTKEVDQAIAARALDTLKPEGRAVLIVGGKQGSPESRRLKYRATEQTKFWAWLFDHFDVLDHFGIDGKMYARQGAGYPIDVIVIGGRGKTTGRSFPGADLPRVYHTFESLEELLHERMVDAAERKPGPDRGSAGSLEPGDSQRGIAVQPDGRQAGRNDREFGKTGRSRSADAGGPGERGADRLRGERERSGAGGQEGTLSTAGKAGAEVSLEGNVLSPGKQARQTALSSESRSGAERRGGRNDAGRVDGRSDAEAVPGRREKSAVAAARQEPQQKATTSQTPYRKASSLPSMGTLVPKNMATAVRNAMTALQKRHGDMDAYVARQLDYTPAQLTDYFAAEQVDALGLAISNLADGAGFVIGDQTGIGKGRVNAGIIRWAKLHGHIPVFVTMKPELYADMVRDLADIGMDGMTPLPTNSGLSGDKAIPLPGGRTLRTGTKAAHEAILRDIMENGMGKYDAVFTTYDQLNSVNKQDTFRRRFMMNMAPQAVFILDESHNAGGQGAERRKASDAVSRAQFVRKMLQASPLGAFYSSATYAKRPESMSLYFKTDMRHAVDDINSLAQAINEGGIPMQQVVAATLAESGQYIRRERSFEGAEVQTLSVPVDKVRAEKCAEIMRAILNFDEVKQESLKTLDEAVAKAGGKALDKKEAGKAGASSINFTAIMHNLIAQSLLAQKVDAVVDAASAAVQRGEKAVITLANTMGSMIQAYAEEHDLTPGDPIDLTFRDMFRHYLESTRQVTIKDSQGRVTEKRPMTDEELGKAGALAYRHALESIETSDFGDLPVSIIDRMLDGLRRKGIEAGEITGRTQRIDYSTGTPTYARRKSGPADNIKTVDAFNSGELDVIILNQSGSTGISLHASSTFKDQRRRNMIIAQPELNIDVFMQTLGRVFRTGQVAPPTYQLLFSDLPAEKRPAAVLSKKMGSLNANTTASKDSDTSFKNIPDFLNKYGDKVAMQIMADNPELNRKMGWPITGEMDEEGAIRKVTGRIPLLSVPEQQQVYDMLESEYSDLIAQMEALGGTGLEAKSLPLDARLREEYEIAPGKDVGKNTPFAASAKLGVYDVKRLGKPWPSEKVKAMVAEAPDPDMAGLEQQADAWLKKRRQGMSDKAFNNLADKTLAQRKAVQATARMFPAGSPVSVSNENALLEGVVVRVYRKGAAENPAALGAWKMDVAVADAAKQLTVTFSQIAKGEEGGVLVKPSARDLDQIYQAFDAGQSDSRETVCIATGNILAAYDKLKRGSVVTFEDHAGNIMPGVLLPRDTEPHLLLGTLDVSLTADQAMEFVKTLSGKATAKTADKLFLLTHSGGAYQFTAPAAKAKGAQYYLNGEVLKAAGQDFVKSGQNMVMRNVPEARARAVLRALEEQGYGFVTDNNQEAAQKLIGQEKPKASFSPGEYLPKVRRGPRPVKASAVRRVADSLGRKAAKAAQTEVVQSFDELPARLREEYGDKARAVEGVYDPATDKVWLVADNLTSLERAADVWAHEQIVHHGLRGMLGEDERKRLLNRLWLSLGGMGNEGIREIAERYGVNPRGDTAARQQVMEEYLAGMAEKKRGALLSPREESLWRRIVAAVREAWAKLVRAVGGRNTAMGKADVDRLLAALGRYVMTGRPEGVRGEDTAGAPAFASVGEDREAAGWAAWEQVRKDTEAWGRQLDGVRTGKASPRQVLTVGQTPGVLQKLGAPDLPMTMTQSVLHKIGEGGKHGLPDSLIRNLPASLAEPVMVFRSATQADSLVALLETIQEGMPVVAAVHLDVSRGSVHINEIASVYGKSNGGIGWVAGEIRAGRRVYADKTKIPAWLRGFSKDQGSRRMSGLQLPGAFVLPADPRGVKILTEKDVVKPVPPDTDKPLASLAGAADRLAEKIGKPKKRALSGISAEELADNPALAGVLEKIGVARPTLAEKWENVKDTWKTTLEQGLFDRFASIKEYSETGYKMARMSTGLGSQLRAIMEFGAPVWRDDAMAVEGKGLREIFDPVAGELDRFLHWMVGRRASRLMEEGRENLLTKRDIAALLDLAEGKTADGKARRAEYEKVFRELAAFKGKVLDFAQAGGIIDPVGRAVWENADYIPFYRVQERMDGVSTRGPRNGKGLTGQNAGIRELKGGMENLGDPLENLLRNFAHLIDAAQKNKAALQVFADLHKAGMAEQLTSERTKAMVQEDSAVLADALEAENLLSGLSAEQKQSLLSVFAIRRDVDASRSKDGGVVYARYQGRPYLFKVADPLLYRALTGMNDRGDTSGVMRFGRRIKRVLTTGVTIMPDFMVRNFLRDSVHSWVVEHKSGLKPLTGSLQGLRATLAMDEDTRQLFASGATFMGNGYRLGNDPEAGRLELERMLKKSRMDKEGFFKSLLDDPKKIASALTLAWDKYESLGGASENAVRHEIYARLRKQGYSHLDAGFAARDIMDFSMRGEFAFIRTLTDLVPFLGARLTGLHRLGQGALENPRAFAVKGGLVALAAVGLFLANLTRHKDEWDELEDWDKDSYFHFWIDGRHFRLPKPFEVGFLFGTIPERMAEQALTDAPSGVFWGRVFRGIADQLAMDPTPQAVKPILEDIANRDSFRGTPIVGQALAGRLPAEQHTARTTMSARMFADAMDALLSPVFGKSSDTGVDALRSPVRLEHLINGYFGGLGSTVLGLSDRVIRWLRDDPALPSARGPEDWPLVRAFYRGDADTAGRTKFEGELYDAMREADELAASLKLLRETGDTEADRRLREEMGERGARMLRERKALNRLRRDFAKFNRMMDAVYRDRTMSSSQKRLRLDELQRKKNELARREWARRRVAVRGG